MPAEQKQSEQEQQLPPNIRLLSDAQIIYNNSSYEVRELTFPDQTGRTAWSMTICRLKPSSQTRGHCLSEDTEILTYSGWKKYDEIDRNELVMSFNTDINRLEWNRIQSKWVYDNYDEHIRVKTANLDLSITSDHRVMLSGKNSKKSNTLQEVIASDLLKLSGFNIPQAGLMDFSGVAMSDDEIALMGVMISEGSFGKSKSKKPENKNKIVRIDLYQAYQSRKWIQDVLDRLGYKYSLYILKHLGRIHNFKYGKRYATSDDTAQFHISGSSATKLLSLTQSKHIPEHFIYNSTIHQFEVLLDYMVMGDGHKHNTNEWRYYTGDKSLADQVQTLCILHGYRCRIMTRDRINRNRSYEVVIFRDRNYSTVRKTSQPNSVFTEKYNGKSWCVSVPNRTIIIRRNGKTAIIGNSNPELVEFYTFVRGEGLVMIKNMAYFCKPPMCISVNPDEWIKIVNTSNTTDLVFQTYLNGRYRRPDVSRKT